jgi:hypothetical protein
MAWNGQWRVQRLKMERISTWVGISWNGANAVPRDAWEVAWDMPHDQYMIT